MAISGDNWALMTAMGGIVSLPFTAYGFFNYLPRIEISTMNLDSLDTNPTGFLQYKLMRPRYSESPCKPLDVDTVFQSQEEEISFEAA